MFFDLHHSMVEKCFSTVGIVVWSYCISR